MSEKQNNLGEKILNAIKEKHISPKPRWTFLFHNYAVWFFGIFSVLVGGLAFSIIIFLSANNDWDVYEYIDRSFFRFIVLTMPYFWIIFLGLFVAVAHYNFKHTKEGYKYELHKIVIAAVLSSMMLGGIFYYAGAGAAADRILVKKMPYYEEFVQGRRMRWLDTEGGFLAGRIAEVTDQNNFFLFDLDNNEWSVTAEESGIMPMVKIKADEHVRMIGEKRDDNRFYAERILSGGRPMPMWFEGAPRPRDGFRRPPNGMHPGGSILPGEVEKMRDLKIKDMEKIGRECAGSGDCELPFDYAVRSNCPFEARCLDGKCAVVCPEFRATPEDENDATPCAQNTDCDCAFYAGADKIDCVCLEGKCGAVVAR